MHPDFQSRGVEKVAFTDQQTGRTVRQLTCNENFESKHSYYDVCPWSPDGKLLAFSSARLEDVNIPYRDGLASRDGQVCVMEIDSGEIFTVARGAFHICHIGSFPVWHPKRNVIFFHRSPEEVGRVDIPSGAESAMPGAIRQISPDGQLIASLSGQLDHEVVLRGVYTRNIDGSDEECIVRTEQLYELTPNKDEFALSQMQLSNTKWTPDGRHILVAMVVPKVRRSLYIFGRDGSEPRWLTHFGHHHSWTPDGKSILFNDWLTYTENGRGRDPRMYLIDFDGSNRRVVIDRPLGSHPIMGPDGNRIADWDRDGVYLAHVREQQVERLVTFRNRFDTTHKGTHPHCLWSPDGSQILYNSAETGHSEIYLTSASGS